LKNEYIILTLSLLAFSKKLKTNF